MRTARYDGLADWYDAWRTHDVEAACLARLLGEPPGTCVHIGCGTGSAALVLAPLGWQVVGLDVSADQPRIARTRARAIVRGDAHALPMRTACVDRAVALFLHTDVDDFDAVVAESARILRPGGALAYVGVHPCFVGPHIDGVSKSETELRVTPGYREPRWVFDAPQFGEGVRKRVGARHVPLASLFAAFTSCGFDVERVEEHGTGVVPPVIALRAVRRPQPHDTA